MSARPIMTIEIAAMWADILNGSIRSENNKWVVDKEDNWSPQEEKRGTVATFRSSGECFEMAFALHLRLFNEMKKV